MKGESHYKWKGGLPTCKKCPSLLSSYTSKTGLCWTCFSSERPLPEKAFTKGDVRITGVNNRLWKGGLPKCKTCSKTLATYSGKTGLCRSCLPLKLVGSTHPNWKGGIATDPTHRRTQRKLWLTNNIARVYYLNGLRRVRELNAPGFHSFSDWKALKERNANTCLSCGLQEPKIRLTQDHIIPLSKGGSNDITNIQPLCRSCNSRKSTNVIVYPAYV